VTGRLTILRLVNINPRPAKNFINRDTRKPQHPRLCHQEVNPRASSSSSARMALSEPSRKRGREEDDDDESRCRRLIKEGTTLVPDEEPAELPPPLPNEPEEVSPPPPEEVLALQPVEVVAPAITAGEATWSVNSRCPFVSGS
jgi:hypothetical protein